MFVCNHVAEIGEMLCLLFVITAQNTSNHTCIYDKFK